MSNLFSAPAEANIPVQPVPSVQPSGLIPSPEGYKTRWLLTAVILLQVTAAFLSGESQVLGVALIVLLSGVYAFFMVLDAGWKNIFGRFSFKETNVKEFLALFVGVFIFSFFLRLTIFSVLANISPKILMADLNSSSASDLLCSKSFCNAFTEVSLLLFIPIIEEVLFRGFIFRRQAFKYGIKKGLIIASFLFAILHGADFIGIFPLGFMAGYFYLKYKSLFLPIALHVFYNSAAALVSLNSTGGGTVALSEVEISGIAHTWWFYSGVALILGYFLLKQVRKNWPQLSAFR